MEDTFRHKGLRKKLVESIARKGIHDPNVLKAIETVPRHFFFDSSFLEFAYDDKPFPIGAGQTISQPFTVAFQTQLLKVSKGDKVLEIGTGSGYQACILASMGAKVYSIERQKSLYLKAKAFLPQVGFGSIKLFYGDGFLGLPAYAPYDKILITAAAPGFPEPLIEQLKPGGIMVAPIGTGAVQKMKALEKSHNGEIIITEHGDFRFVPMLPNKVDE